MPATPRKILVIANETCASRGVCDEVRYRAGSQGAEVMVVAPAMARSRLEHWLTRDTEANRAAAEERLATSVAALREAGLDARGEGGDADPMLAMDDALRVFAADEVVISTHPPDRSHWLERRVVKQARERYRVPITHIVVDLEHERASAEGDERVRAEAARTPRLRLYHHAESYEDAMAIAGSGGFSEAGGGVLFTDRPGPEEAEDRMGFALDIPEEVLAPYERPAEGGGRSFVLPAALLNRYGPPVASGDWSE
jgi:hypothetical protein